MTSPLISNGEVVFNFIPSGYISTKKKRINVKELPKEEIQKAMQTADVLGQEVILQDLLLAGRKMKTTEQRNMVALAAELYVQAPENTQKDFLMHLVGAKDIYQIFSSAMLANSIYHQSIESIEKGSSGLSVDQLNKEKALAITLSSPNLTQ